MRRVPDTVCLPLLLASLLGGGCVGYDTALMATKTNAGLDIDTTPPTLEASLARLELAITPSFENGKTPPLAASFKVSGAWVFSSVSSTFVGGDAAATMTGQYHTLNRGTNAVLDGDIVLTNKPVSRRGWFGRRRPVELFEAGEVRPLVFGTDTSAGVKVAWSWLTGQYPDTVRAGFHRNELAIAPVHIVGDGSEGYRVNVPSFLATTDAACKTTSPCESKLEWVQYFAVGTAADYLAAEPQIREAMVKRLDPAADLEARDATDAARKVGTGLALDIGSRIQALDLAGLQAGLQKSADLGILAPGQAADLKALGASNLAGAKGRWIEQVNLRALASVEEHPRLYQLLGSLP